jgi:hypothetical protein
MVSVNEPRVSLQREINELTLDDVQAAIRIQEDAVCIMQYAIRIQCWRSLQSTTVLLVVMFDSFGKRD